MPSSNNNVGCDKIDNLVDDYEIIEEVSKRYNHRYYRMVCSICGHEKICGDGNIRKQDNHHSPFNCKDDYYKDIIGQCFGDYECIDIQHNDKPGFKAIIKCSVCGCIKSINASSIKKEYIHSPLICRNSYYQSMIGKEYGDLKIIGVGSKSGNEITYCCECKICGTKCKRTLRALEKGIKHGAECFKQVPDSKIKQVVANRWYNMYSRCNNPNNTSYSHYGARGIKLMYQSPIDLYYDFADELKEFAKTHDIRNSTFDRIDVNGNYEKSNLRVTTQQVQNINTTRKRYFIIEKDEQRIVSDSAMECGRYLGVNGHSMGNVVRGSSKTCSGWHLYKILKPDENIQDIIEREGVTTNLIMSL